MCIINSIAKKYLDSLYYDGSSYKLKVVTAKKIGKFKIKTDIYLENEKFEFYRMISGKTVIKNEDNKFV